MKQGQTALRLLWALGYDASIIDHKESGRTAISKGFLDYAKEVAIENISIFKSLLSNELPLIGIEPSAILTFRDEYIDLTRGEMKENAKTLAKHVFTMEEFLTNEMEKGHITASQFTDDKRLIKFHGHCHQKALSSQVPSKKILSLPANYEVQIIPSGCCGMAGSFGYEKEHYDVSMQVGELVLFPTIRKQDADVIITAPGTSCRHQIKDGANRNAKHPVEVLYEALV